MQEKLRFLEEGDTLRVKITGEIDHHSTVALRSQIDSHLFNLRPKILKLDFSGVNFMDSSGIGLIMGRLEKSKSCKTELWVVGLSKTAYKLIALSGLTKIEGLTLVLGRETR
jgi:stage II sporulation protein AA (anti-sigma F factor antagonist)